MQWKEDRFSTYELTVYEETAFRVLKPLIDKHGTDFCRDLNSVIWDEFCKSCRDEILKDDPANFDLLSHVELNQWKALGLNTYAIKMLKDDRERRAWQYSIWPNACRPFELLATVIIEEFEDLIQDLDKVVTPHFINCNNFEKQLHKELKDICEEIKAEVNKKFINAKVAEDFLKCQQEYEERITTACTKRRSERLDQQNALWETYWSELKNWFCKRNLCDESKNPPKAIMDKAHEWISKSYSHEHFNATTKISSWGSTIGTQSLKDFLLRTPSQSPLWAWQMAMETVTILSVEPKHFDFKFSAWLPNITGGITEQIYEKHARKAFEIALAEYLAEMRETFQVHTLNTQSTPTNIEEHIEWLIRRVAFNEPLKSIANKYNTTNSNILKGVRKAGHILNIAIK